MLKIPGRRSYRSQDSNAITVKVGATGMDDQYAGLLRLIADKKIRVSRSGLHVTAVSTGKVFEAETLSHMLSSLGRSGYIDLEGQDRPWWDFEDVTVYLTSLGEAVLAAREALTRAGAAAAKKIAAQA